MNGCSEHIPAYTSPCDEPMKQVKAIKAKKDEFGNLLVMINDDGKWRGADIITDEQGNKIIKFSY